MRTHFGQKWGSNRDLISTRWEPGGDLMGTRAGKSDFYKSVIKADAQGAFIRLLYINVVADVLDR